MKIKLLLTSTVLAFSFLSVNASASNVIQVDVDHSTVITQAGFTSMTGNSVTDGGVTVEILGTSELNSGGFRDRGSIGAHPLDNLLRDFTHATGVNSDNWIDLKVSGLSASTNYNVKLYGYDDVYNDGRGTAWYEGSSTSIGSLITGFENDNDAVVQPVFDEWFMTNGLGELFFYGVGDPSYGDVSAGTASVVLFNGLEVCDVPEPSTYITWGVMGLVGSCLYLKRRKK